MTSSFAYKRRLLALSVAATTIFLSCIHTQQPEKSRILNTKKSPTQKDSDSSPATIDSSSLPPEDPECIAFEGSSHNIPLWIKEKDVVITRMLKECTTRSNQKGYQAKSPWVAMGFPCTAGSGKIDVGGHYWAPKIVSLLLSTNCAMNQNNLQDITNTGRTALNLHDESKLMALNPFAVQYWEIPGLEDADVGFSIDLRSIEAKQRVWRSFLEKKPIPVKLYGRENAWVRGYDFFYVEGELHHTGTFSFKLKVLDVKPLSENEIEEIRHRCEALQPRRNCSQVFS